jgi:hypothetical protein
METINVVILAKSVKHGNYCVAGFDINTMKMVRLCSSDVQSDGALALSNILYDDDSIIQIGDVVEVVIIEPVASKIQPENMLIDETRLFVKTDAYLINKLLEFVQEDQFVFLDTNDRLSTNSALTCQKSLSFLLVDDLKLESVDINNKTKTKASFKYKDRHYSNFAVTDQDYYKIVSPKTHKQAMICFSLPDDKWAKEHDEYYKFAAKIIPME